MKILIGADIVPTKNNLEFFCKGNISAFVDESVINVLNSYDYRICNLETPLCNKKTPINKCGANHFTPTTAINSIKKLRINLCAMANNHIMDQGINGLISTIDTLKKNEINYCGVGDSIEDAEKIYLIEQNGEKIGVYNCAEHEFSIANENHPGANPFDALYSFDYVAKQKQNVDYLIVLYHGGKEYYRYPSPYLQKICRRFIEKGADLVICQHSHCIGSKEQYNGGTIVYGQGNFIFYDESNPCGNTSLLVGVDTFNKTVFYHPISYNGKVCMLKKQESNKVLYDFNNRSEKLLDIDFLKKEYDSFAYNKSRDYLKVFMGKRMGNLLYRIINRLSKGLFYDYLIKRTYDNRSLITILNYIKCEAHNELIIKGLEKRCEMIGKENA